MRIDTHTHIYICYVHTIHGISKSSSAYRIQEPINVANCTMKPYHFLRLITSLKRAAVSLSLSLHIYIHTRIYVSTIDTYGCIYILTIYLYMYDYTYLHAHTHTHALTNTHPHTYTHTYTHTHIYIHIHMHTHAYMRVDGWIWSWHLDFVPAAPPLTVELEVPNGCEAQPW